MKIFNTENGKKKVYVQMRDLVMINHFCTNIPESIIEKMYEDDVVLDQNNMGDFVEFTDESEIEYFTFMDWIIDYKKNKDLTEEEIEEKEQDTISQMNNLAKRYNSMSEEEKPKNQDLVERHELLKYKLMSYNMLTSIKQGDIEIKFPNVPDSDGFTFSAEDIDYEIRASIDPYKTFLYRKDGKELSKDEKIPNSFIQMGMSIALLHMQEQNHLVTYFVMYNSISDDNKYLITKFIPHKKEEMVEDKDDSEIEQTNEKGIRKLIRNIFKRKK